MVTIGENAVFTKIVSGQDPRLSGALDHLVLMPGIQGDGLAILLIGYMTHGPAALKLGDLAAPENNAVQNNACGDFSLGLTTDGYINL